MHVTFWGTRGSIAKAGASTLRYGGNTSCVEVTADDGTTMVIDCGTGGHGLGQDLMARSGGEPLHGHVLITHTHWDHIQGLPFFTPLFIPGNHWNIYGPSGLGSSITDALEGQMQYTYFPISLDQLASNIDYHDLVEGSFDIGDSIRVVTQYLNHPALTLGYRLECGGASVVYSSDHEPHHRELAAGGDFTTSPQDCHHAEFFAGADLLIHDAQYLASEYEAKAGWGHSTVEYVVSAAHHAGVKRLALYHHDPTRTDADVDAVVQLARTIAAELGYEGEIFAAAEGMTVEVVADGSPRGERKVHREAKSKPAFEDAGRGILVSVSSDGMAAIIRDAAEAEGLDVWVAGPTDDLVAMAREHEPSVVVLETDIHGKDTAGIADELRELLPLPYGDEVHIVAVTTSGRRHGSGMASPFTDWLVWPASEVYVRTKLHSWVMRRACRWQAAPLPADEARRLRSLRALGILDTSPEDRFDRLTEMAGRVADAPVALVSLVDASRQWFKSKLGLDATETPRDMAFCAHAILDDKVFQVQDTLVDPRFADNPVVQGDPRVRFYAGVPLKLSDGSRAGTLCVVDYRPRNLDERQLAELCRLGDLVVKELETDQD